MTNIIMLPRKAQEAWSDETCTLELAICIAHEQGCEDTQKHLEYELWLTTEIADQLYTLEMGEGLSDEILSTFLYDDADKLYDTNAARAAETARLTSVSRTCRV